MAWEEGGSQELQPAQPCRWEEEVGYQTGEGQSGERQMEEGHLGERQMGEGQSGERQLAWGEGSCRQPLPSRRARVEQKACRWVCRWAYRWEECRRVWGRVGGSRQWAWESHCGLRRGLPHQVHQGSLRWGKRHLKERHLKEAVRRMTERC